MDTQRSDPLAPPWPDLVIGASRRAAPLARWIKKRSGGRSRLVHLLHAQAPLHYFDLVVTTPQYRLPERSNVLHNLLPLNAAQPEVLESSGAQWRRRLEHLPRPWIAVLVGGNSSSYRLDPSTARQLGQFTSRTARETGGSLLISSSPRTPPDAADALLAAVQGPAYVYRWQPTNRDENAYLAYLALADHFIVTADSASMLAEACSTGRPVELFDWTPRRQPKRLLRAFPGSQRLEEALIYWGIIKPKRDFQALHRELMKRGLLCSPGQKESLRPAKPDDLARTVTRIRRLMGEGGASGRIHFTRSCHRQRTVIHELPRLRKARNHRPAQFQQAKPYPWLNPVGMLTETGYQRLLANLPDISLFEPMFGIKRSHGQRPHDRYVLEYRDKLDCSRAGASSSPNFGASVTAGSCGACSAEAESSSTFTGITPQGLFRLAPLRRQTKTRLPHLLFQHGRGLGPGVGRRNLDLGRRRTLQPQVRARLRSIRTNYHQRNPGQS